MLSLLVQSPEPVRQRDWNRPTMTQALKDFYFVFS